MKDIIEGPFEVQEHFELDANQQQLIDEGVNQLGIEDILLHGEEYKEQIVEIYDKIVRKFRPDIKTATHLSSMKSHNTSWGTFVDNYLEPPYLEVISDREQIESIADYMVSVEEIRFDNWKDLSLEQQVDILNQMEQRIANIEHRPAATISAKELDAKTYGYQLEDSIVINSKYLNASASSPEMLEQMLNTLIHEGRHRYQHYNVDERLVHDSIGKVNSWRENFYELGYKDGSPIHIIEFGPIGLFTNERLSDEGKRLYYYQPVEIDAREFAMDVMHEYHKELGIEEYTSTLLEDYIQFENQTENRETNSNPLTSEDFEPTLELPKSDEISFGRSESQIENDIDYYNKKLRRAHNDADYYTKELSRSNISDTYRKKCQFELSQATQRINELTRKISSLGRELEK